MDARRQSDGLTADLSPDEGLFRQAIAEFAAAEIAPHVRDMDHHARLAPGLLDKLFAMGLMGIEIPEQYGGAGGTFFDSINAVEELAKVDPGVSVIVDVQNTLVVNALLRWGTEAQKQRYLPRLATNTVGSYCLSEAASGSDAFALQCRASTAGDDYEIAGQKLWITNALEAGLFLVFATTDPALGYKGISCFLVERDQVSLGKKEDKLGIRASSTCEVVLNKAKGELLGPLGQGYKIAIETLNEGRIGIGAQMLGLAEAALAHAVKYAKERKQFGQAIAEFQGVQYPLADSAVEIEAARHLVYHAARLRDQGRPFVQEAAMAKYFASTIAEQVASRAVEIFGGFGYSKDYPVEKLYRDAKIGRIYEGTSNMQRAVIAKHLLK
ncbi:MAG: acyl-CoA dehydrogenase family protein [Bryobacter sp.]|nr:acyl-CoA dehydrogenase family protein [Bryobacter sp.]